MSQIISRNIIRTIIMILAAGLVIGIFYALSFTSPSATNAYQGEYPGGNQGEGQIQPPSEGGNLGSFEGNESGFGQRLGQGNGFGAGSFDGQEFGRARIHGDDFSLSRGLTELATHTIVIIALILVVTLIQRVVKRRRRVLPAA